MSKCRVKGCKKTQAMGIYCLNHYREAYPEKSKCKKRGCDGLVARGGLCWKHYREVKPAKPKKPTKREQLKKAFEPKEPREALKAFRGELELRKLKSERKQLLKELDLAERRLHVMDGLRKSAVSGAIKPRESHIREAIAVVMASDWHVGELVVPAKVHYKNEFGIKSMHQRVEEFFWGSVWLVKHHRTSFAINELILWVGGDIITGYLHEDQRESNSMPPIKEVLVASQLLSRGIEFLIEELDLEKVHVLCNYGNHGRTTDKIRFATAAENSFEFLMYHSLAEQMSKNKRVEFTISDGPHIYYQVYDFWTRWLHGDVVKYRGGIGGMFIPLRRAYKDWQTIHHCDFTTLGHFHQSHLDAYNMAVNGSLIGYSPYSMAKNFEYTPPAQGFYLIDSKRGKCMMTDIWVDKSGN